MGRLTHIDGLPVVDAKEPVRLHILPEDVAKAETKDPSDCVVARACRRDLHAKEARIHLSRVYLRTNKGNWQRYMTSRPMRQEIITFDRGGTFQPGEYELWVPQAHKLTGKRIGGPSKNLRPRPAPKFKRKYHYVTNVRNGPA